MDQHVTFEERVGRALDVLSTGALLLTKDEARAESLVLAVVTEAFRARPPREQREFRNWILMRMFRRYVEHVGAGRELEGSFSRPDGEEREPAPDPSSDLGSLLDRLGALERRDPARLAAILRTAIADLPLRERASVWLVTVLGFSYAEAASALAIDRSDLRLSLYRGRRALQTRLARAVGEAAPGEGRSGGPPTGPRAESGSA